MQHKSINDNWSLFVRFNHLQEAFNKKVAMAKYVIEVPDLKKKLDLASEAVYEAAGQFLIYR